MKYSSALLILCTLLGEFTDLSWQAQLRCPVPRLRNGIVRARARGRIVRFNCLDGFTLVGNKYSTCIRGKWDTPLPVCVSGACQLPPTPEHALMAAKYNKAILLYFCEPGYTLIGPSEIYCNGQQWNGTTPYCRDTNATAPTKCDFEKPDLCWWEQDPEHDFDWQRHNFETPSAHAGTGPTYDHTLGQGNEGYYLYIEASGRLINDTARISSPLYNSSLSNSGCFSFWYHMYGTTMGTLRIYFKPESEKARLMFTKDGNQKNLWHHGMFDLPQTNQSFQIVIEGVRGYSYVSDIAIDDVAILQGAECRGNETAEQTTMADTGDDQIELINALQSCKGRCNNPQGEPYVTLLPPNAPDACQCTDDCADTSVCCPDYAEYCVLALPDETFSTENVGVFSVTTPTTKIFTTPSRKVTTRRNAMSSTTTLSINSKDEIDPNVSLPPWKPQSSTWRKWTTPRMTTRGTTMLTTTRKTTKLTVANFTTTTTTKVRTTVGTTRKTTPISLSTMPPRHDAVQQVTYDGDDHMGNKMESITKTLRESTLISVPAIVGAIIGVLIAVAMTTMVAIFLLRRRKTYKRGTSGSALSEDSDVRFLTSDEILDFNLARPSDNDEL